MGGCYRDDSSSSCSYRTVSDWESSLKRFARTKERAELFLAYKEFFQNNSKGFFARLASVKGIDAVENIPKEFPGMEYEVKFDIGVSGKGNEPSIEQYLDAFDFPVVTSARFLKDPVNTVLTGVNHFFGDGLDERLVVIEKLGKTYLKEKGAEMPVEADVPYANVVIKRSEKRYECSIEQIVEKVAEVAREENAEYKGRIRKEKGDAFVLDTNDGRIYSFTVTRAHLTRSGEKKESAIQRQLEIEYAGYIPGFDGFEKNSELGIVAGIVDLARYVAVLHQNAPIANGWRVNLALTNERKYDFVAGADRIKLVPKAKEKVELLETSRFELKNAAQ